MTGLTAVVFDLDDTLYPEETYVLSGFRAVAHWAQDDWGLAADEGYAELEALFRQGVRGETFDRWLAAHALPAEPWVARLVAIYRAHQPTIAPYPGVPALLARLGRRYRLGLLSDGYLAVQRNKLAALGLGACFQAVVFSDEGGRACWKPSTWPYQRVMERLQCPPERTVYLGDNPLKDFTGARQVGMGTIWLRRPGGVYCSEQPPTPEHAPDAQISALEELETLLDVWEQHGT
jgi:putative hydrolase of the HAD superfamily